MPKYIWMCLNCQNGFLFYISHCNHLSTWTQGCLFQDLPKTGSYRLKEHEVVFLYKIWFFFTAAGSIWFAFCFRLKMLTLLNLEKDESKNRCRFGLKNRVAIEAFVNTWLLVWFDSRKEVFSIIFCFKVAFCFASFVYQT